MIILILLFEILKKYCSIFKKFNIVNKDLINELLSEQNKEKIENIKNIIKYINYLLLILTKTYLKNLLK